MGALTYLVTGVGGPAGRAVAGRLHHLGRAVVGVDTGPVPVAAYPAHQVAPADTPRYVPAMFELCRRYGVDVVVPTLAEELTVMAAVKHTAQRSGISIAVSDSVSVNVACDRWLTFQYLRQLSVPVAHTLLASDVDSAAQIRAHLDLPLLRKPRSGIDSSAVTLHRDLRTVFAGIAEKRYVLQEFLPGHGYSANLYLGLEGVVRGAVLRLGDQPATHRVPDTDVTALAVAAARAVGLVGAVEVELCRRADGTPAVLEINPRYGLHCGAVPETIEALVDEHEIHAVA